MHPCPFTSNLLSLSIALKVFMLAQNDVRCMKALENKKVVRKGLN